MNPALAPAETGFPLSSLPLPHLTPRFRQMISVSILEDSPPFAAELVRTLSASPGIVLLDRFGHAEEALEKMPQRPPTVALIDIHLPGLSGVECIARLATRLLDTSFVVLSSHDQDAHVFDALRAGAVGYLVKSQSGDGIVGAVRLAASGGSPMTPAIARRVVRFFSQPQLQNRPELLGLTPRELSVLAPLAKGLRYKEIADQLGIGEETVRTHLRNIYAKLHVTSRTEAVTKYLGH
ncbi:MAG: response regulator transcription factor [Verrucomicrobia bacterium]|nr:response regulator transcription factor [Verrucomicrobiota bacterium]